LKDDPIIDRDLAQKCIRVDQLREELKALGYSVVSTRWLVGLQIQAKRLQATEVENEEAYNAGAYQSQDRSAQGIAAEIS